MTWITFFCSLRAISCANPPDFEYEASLFTSLADIELTLFNFLALFSYFVVSFDLPLCFSLIDLSFWEILGSLFGILTSSKRYLSQTKNVLSWSVSSFLCIGKACKNGFLAAKEILWGPWASSSSISTY